MARMYSRNKGKAGSKKPVKKAAPLWLRYKPKEIELLIVKLAKEGNSPSQIGIVLRDSYGVSDARVVLKKRISEVLTEKKLLTEVPEDLTAMIKKVVVIRKHLESNRHDETARRGLILSESKIKRLVKYYKRSGRLASEWKYDITKAGLLTE